MRRRNLEKFLFLIDKDRALQERFEADPEAALQPFGLSPEEAAALKGRDVAALWRWQLHPLLIRNFAGTFRIDYVTEYARAGIKPHRAGS